MSIQENHLVKKWLHLHEEDTATQLVYRPADYAFPPARGRRGYEFLPNHSCNYIGISPRDGPATESCSWEWKAGEPPEIVLSFARGRKDVLRVISLDSDRLIVQKSTD